MHVHDYSRNVMMCQYLSYFSSLLHYAYAQVRVRTHPSSFRISHIILQGYFVSLYNEVACANAICVPANR